MHKLDLEFENVKLARRSAESTAAVGSSGRGGGRAPNQVGCGSGWDQWFPKTVELERAMKQWWEMTMGATVLTQPP